MTNSNNAIIVIQCRYDSVRLEGKILKELKHGLTCLEYLVQRLEKANFNVLLATSDRDEDLPIIDAFYNMRCKYNHLIGFVRGSYENIAERLYTASEGYKYCIRITGDDIFVDTEQLNAMAEYSMENNLDYVYQKDIIRGCDCDIFKRKALGKAMEMYDTSKMTSIEFLFRNEKFKQEAYKIPESYNIPFSLTLDTEQDWKLIKIVFDKLYNMNPHFTAWDIAEFYSRNRFLTDINRKPKVSVYVVYRDYPLDWLKQCMDSIREQTFKDYEVILIDYGSKQMHSFLSYINDKSIQTYSLEDKTFIEAVQFAISISQGKYIMRVDADDFILALGLEEMIAYLEKNPFYSAVVPDHYLYVDNAKAEARKGDSLDFPLPTCALIEKSKYAYVEFLEGQPFRDKINWVYCFEKYDFKIGYLHKPLFYYRIHDNSISHGGVNPEVVDTEEKRIKSYFNKSEDERKPNN